MIGILVASLLAHGAEQSEGPSLIPFGGYRRSQEQFISSRSKCFDVEVEMQLAALPRLELKKFSIGDREASAEELLLINSQLSEIDEFFDFSVGCSSGGFHGLTVRGRDDFALPYVRKVTVAWSHYGFRVLSDSDRPPGS